MREEIIEQLMLVILVMFVIRFSFVNVLDETHRLIRRTTRGRINETYMYIAVDTEDQCQRWWR